MAKAADYKRWGNESESRWWLEEALRIYTAGA